MVNIYTLQSSIVRGWSYVSRQLRIQQQIPITINVAARIVLYKRQKVHEVPYTPLIACQRSAIVHSVQVQR